MPPSISFREHLDAAQQSAVHLEMRDIYGIGDEAGDFEHWKRTDERDVDPASAYWAPWVELIQAATARDVTVRRARLVSEPATDYIRYEHAGTDVNILAGEEVRWLPRSRSSDLMLPGNDLWIFDGQTLLFNHFTGDGDWTEPGLEPITDARIVKQCTEAFEAVWDRAVPHDQFTLI